LKTPVATNVEKNKTYHIDDVEGDEGAFGAREVPAHLAGFVRDLVTQKKKYKSGFPLRK
jgi:hypothetical protein